MNISPYPSAISVQFPSQARIIRVIRRVRPTYSNGYARRGSECFNDLFDIFSPNFSEGVSSFR